MYIGYYYILKEQRNWGRIMSKYQGINIADERADNFTHMDSRIFLEVLHGRRIRIKTVELKQKKLKLPPIYIADFIWERYYKIREQFVPEDPFKPLEEYIPDSAIKAINPILFIQQNFSNIKQLRDIENIVGVSIGTCSPMQHGVMLSMRKETAIKFAPFLDMHPELVQRSYVKWRAENVGDKTPREVLASITYCSGEQHHRSRAYKLAMAAKKKNK